MDTEIISRELLEILVCPECKANLELVQYIENQHGLKCMHCRNIYPIRDGIPVMLLDEAIPLE